MFHVKHFVQVDLKEILSNGVYIPTSLVINTNISSICRVLSVFIESRYETKKANRV